MASQSEQPPADLLQRFTAELRTNIARGTSVTVEIPSLTLAVLIGQLQIALGNRLNQGVSAEMTREFVNFLINIARENGLVAAAELAEKGFVFDVEKPIS